MTKKLFKHSILPALVALLFSATSCVSERCLDPITPGDGVDRTVTVRLAPSAATRGVSRPICDGEPVQFNQGMMYLVTSTGAISRYFPITARDSGAATNLVVDAGSGLTMSGTINIACLEGGKDIGLVPSNVARVVIVGNSQVALPTSGAIGSIISGTTGLVSNATNNTVATQFDAFFTPGVNMFANYPLVYNTTASVWEAEMTLAPTVARFEIAKMTGMGMIESYSVDGIFIDRYIRQATRDGNFYPNNGVAPVIHGAQNSAVNFAVGAHDYITKVTAGGNRTSGALFTAYSPALAAAPHTPYGVVARPGGTHTWGTTGCLVEDCCAPGTTVQNAWSFQLFARDFVRPGGTPTPATTTPPVIIVRLRDVVVRTGVGTETQNIGTQYLTVANFDRREAGGTGVLTPLTGIRASNVYHIANLVFNQDDLYIHPYPTDRTVRVEVVVSEWNGQEIRPNIFRQPHPIGGTATFLDGAFTFPFPLGAAVAGCTDSNNILYQWEYSVCRTVWTAIGTPSNANRTHTATGLTTTTYFRRVAICGCASAKRIVTMPARVTVPNCIPIGTPGTAGFACWAFYNLASRDTFVEEIYHRGALFQWNSLTAWSNTDPRQRNDATTSWAWTTSAIDVDWENTQNTGAAWNTALCPCPEGWVTPNSDQLVGLGPGIWIAATAVNPVTGTMGHPGRIFGPGASATTFDPFTQVFLPAAGQRFSLGALGSVGAGGSYWSSIPSGANDARALYSDGGGIGVNAPGRANAFSVRCVAE